MAVGAVAQAAAWRLVSTGRLSVWTAQVSAVGAAGVAALASGRIGLSPEAPLVVAGSVGLVSGAALYAATRAFVWAVRPWRAFRRHVEHLYGERQGLPLPAALTVAVGVVVVGEELFWRGLFQGRVVEEVGRIGAAALTWAAYVAANAFSRSLPLLAGAVVGGAVWAALASWTQGVLASLLCHAAWTTLMIAVPPVREPAGVGPTR